MYRSTVSEVIYLVLLFIILCGRLVMADEANAAPPAIKLVYAPRKLDKFSGECGDTSYLEDWIVQARDALTSQGLTGKQAADFLLAHLEGSAWREVKHAKEDERANADGIFTILQEEFGEIQSENELLEEFFGRRRKPKETLREFSHALMALIDRAFALKDNVLPNRDAAL